MPNQKRISEFEQIVQNYLPFEANKNQKEAIHELCKFIFDGGERNIFILKGYAGTGKSNLISALTLALPAIRWRSVLLAPTGRAAKVLSAYAKRPAQTIHKKIFKKVQDQEGNFHFALTENLHKSTLFVVDEASMIGIEKGGSINNNSLLENLFEYVYSGNTCKLILVGDDAQLPPVGNDQSFALDSDYLNRSFHLNIFKFELNEVVRQKLNSGILLAATEIREAIDRKPFQLPKINCEVDIYRLSGEELEFELNNCISNYGEENVTIITRSNKGCNLYNRHFRNRIKYFEEDLCTGDKIMVVKNNYFWLEDNESAAFIANGDTAEITRIVNREDTYGFNFCECSLKLFDYPNLPEMRVKIITNSLYSDSPALTEEDQKKLYTGVMEEVAHEPLRHVRSAYLKKSPYYNALQVKFKYAVTCHKAQGGQWPCVFIDIGYVDENSLNENFCRWLYTAITRATDKVVLINFPNHFFES